jgi:hypothetical protein
MVDLCRSSNNPAVIRTRFIEPVRQEILSEVAGCHETQVESGAKFLEVVVEAAARSLAYPMTGSQRLIAQDAYFSRIFPIMLVSQPDDQAIIVFALAHHAWRPGYWRRRTEDS